MTKLNKVLVTFIIGIFSVTANASLIFTSDQIAFNDAIVVGASDDFESLGLGPGGILGLGNNVNRSDFTYSAPTGLVGLGSGINNNDSSNETITTLYQRLDNKGISPNVNGANQSSSGEVSFSGATNHWVLSNYNTGFYLFSGNHSLKVKKEVQQTPNQNQIF